MSDRDVLQPLIVSPYRWTVYVADGDEELHQLEEEYVDRKLPVSDDQAGVHFLLTASGGDFSLIYVDSSSDDFYYILAHECLHCVHAMMSDRGVPINQDTTEVQAYHLEGLIRRVIETLEL